MYLVVPWNLDEASDTFNGEALPANREWPKSQILAVPASVTKTLGYYIGLSLIYAHITGILGGEHTAFKSPCTTPRLCMCDRPSRVSRILYRSADQRCCSHQ